jgi:hypothetical protein
MSIYISSQWDPGAGLCEDFNEAAGSIKAVNFLDHLYNFSSKSTVA